MVKSYIVTNYKLFTLWMPMERLFEYKCVNALFVSLETVHWHQKSLKGFSVNKARRHSKFLPTVFSQCISWLFPLLSSGFLFWKLHSWNIWILIAHLVLICWMTIATGGPITFCANKLGFVTKWIQNPYMNTIFAFCQCNY